MAQFHAGVQLAFILHFAWPPTGVDLRFLWSIIKLIRTQGDACFHRLATQRKSAEVDSLQVVCICVKFTASCDLHELESPFGHPSQVRT